MTSSDGVFDIMSDACPIGWVIIKVQMRLIVTTVVVEPVLLYVNTTFLTEFRLPRPVRYMSGFSVDPFSQRVLIPSLFNYPTLREGKGEDLEKWRGVVGIYVSIDPPPSPPYPPPPAPYTRPLLAFGYTATAWVPIYQSILACCKYSHGYVMFCLPFGVIIPSPVMRWLGFPIRYGPY